MSAATGLTLGERAYRLLLRCYPPAFRARFGDEMVAFYRARRLASPDARDGWALWRHLIADLLQTAPRERWQAWRLRRAARAADLAHEPPGAPMDTLRQDIRYAVRALVRRPAFTVVAALTLALGIGATTTVWSFVSAVLLRPLPWPEADRLVLLTESRGGVAQRGLSYVDFTDWRRESRRFAAMGVFRGQSINLTGRAEPERLIGSFVSAATLDLLGARAAQGRLFVPRETEVETKAPVAVISDAAWRSRFGARADLLGSVVTLNGQAFTVVGILAPGFQAPFGTPEVLLPIGYYPNAGDLTTRGQPGVGAIGRLAPDATLATAQAEMDVIARRLAERFPDTNAGLGVAAQPLAEQILGPTRAPLLVALGAVATVLLIACANIASLQLARAAARARELSVRAALGAGRARLARQLLTESVLLAVVGGTAGVLLAWWGVQALAALTADALPLEVVIGLDARVLGFATAATLLAGLLSGLVPAWQHSRADVHSMLGTRGEGNGAPRGIAREALVVAQVAMCVVLLASAGLLARSLDALGRVAPGFDVDRLLTLQFRLPAARYDSEEKIAAMFDRAIGEIRATPGVERAALVRATPLNGNGERVAFLPQGQPDGEPGTLPQLQLNIVTPGYFDTMRIPRLAGRDFTTQDAKGAPVVAVVNERLAKLRWPGEPAIGKRLRIDDLVEGGTWATVVGVVGTTRHFSLGEEPLEQAYVAHAQHPMIFTEVVVRASGDPLAVAGAVKAAIWRVDPDQPVWRVRTMETVLADALGQPKVMSGFVGGFALLSLLLAAVGVYGVTSHMVARRSHEVGIRIALGARAGQVLGLVLRQGMRTIALALAIGLPAAFAATRLLESQLYGVGTADPLTFAAVPLVLGVVALLACWLPARRASRVDPLVALRAE